ncbi:LLM class flavin-dependent oxidoreductase [Variovorax sp. HJSM1_2]|uniref:LLM class flavin-dependent oxidoreductase n=1 Tax=Variovorax sp. HJSM1_2 TaxID=3366263 RepID=UPI003BD8C0D7
MSLEFIGYIGTQHSSEIIDAPRSGLDLAHVEQAARIHEQGGFDRALVAFHSTSPESILVAAHAASVTQRLGFMVAHRPGFTQPTLAARQLATLDVITGGRSAVHIITGGNEVEMRQDGSFIDKEERYARSDEYLQVLRKVWTSTQPFDHQGRFYRYEQAFSHVRSPQAPHIPVYFGGSSDAAIEVAGRHADVYALWGETHEQVRETVARVRAAAAKHGRTIRFSLSLRPILADTEAAAWARAEHILEQARALAARNGKLNKAAPLNVGSQRLLAAAAQGDRLDKRLWTGIAGLLGAQGNSTALVGTPEQVADALLDYRDLGISTFLIRGFEPLADALAYGRDLLPLVRAQALSRPDLSKRHAPAPEGVAA